MHSIKKIICALDLSSHSTFVAEYALTIAKASGAAITVVYVTPVLSQYMGINVSTASLEKLDNELRSNAAAGLGDFVKESFPGSNVKVAVLNGHPAEEIINYAASSKADLIVMGTQGHRGLNRMLFGSVAEGVVRASAVPVITVRSKE